MKHRILATFAATCLLACGPGSDSSSAPQAPAPSAAPAQAAPAVPAQAAPDAAADAEKIFATRCFTCHGEKGAGDGPGSGGLTPPPRNFQDAAWQTSVSDEHIEQIILYGGAAVGRSPMMPGNPDLNSKPEVVSALVVHIRELASD